MVAGFGSYNRLETSGLEIGEIEKLLSDNYLNLRFWCHLIDEWPGNSRKDSSPIDDPIDTLSQVPQNGGVVATK